ERALGHRGRVLGIDPGALHHQHVVDRVDADVGAVDFASATGDPQAVAVGSTQGDLGHPAHHRRGQPVAVGRSHVLDGDVVAVHRAHGGGHVTEAEVVALVADLEPTGRP